MQTVEMEIGNGKSWCLSRVVVTLSRTLGNLLRVWLDRVDLQRSFFSLGDGGIRINSRHMLRLPMKSASRCSETCNGKFSCSLLLWRLSCFDCCCLGSTLSPQRSRLTCLCCVLCWMMLVGMREVYTTRLSLCSEACRWACRFRCCWLRSLVKISVTCSAEVV